MIETAKKELSPLEIFLSKINREMQESIKSSYEMFEKTKEEIIKSSKVLQSKESEKSKSSESSDSEKSKSSNSRRMLFDEIIDTINGNINDDSKDFLKDNFGCDIRCILDDFQKIANYTEENKNGEAVAIIKKLTKDFKQMAIDSIDNFSNYMIDYINPKEQQTIQDQFEEILTSKGFQYVVDDDESNKTKFNGLVHLTAKKDDNTVINCLIDNDGIYCNKIPKVFIADIDNGQLLFAIKNDMLEKYVDAIKAGTLNADIINDKTIKQVVRASYMDLHRVHGIDLWDKTLLSKNRSLYELVKSKEWKGYDAAIKTNLALSDEDRKLSVNITDNTITIVNAKTGRQLFIITETNDGKIIKVTAIPFVTITPQQPTFQGVPIIPQPIQMPIQQSQPVVPPEMQQPVTADILQSMIIEG